MKYFIKDFFSKCNQIRWKLQETVDLVTFTEEILNGKLHFLCSDSKVFFYYIKTTPTFHISEIWQ